MNGEDQDFGCVDVHGSGIGNWSIGVKPKLLGEIFRRSSECCNRNGCPGGAVLKEEEPRGLQKRGLSI